MHEISLHKSRQRISNTWLSNPSTYARIFRIYYVGTLITLLEKYWSMQLSVYRPNCRQRTILQCCNRTYVCHFVYGGSVNSLRRVDFIPYSIQWCSLHTAPYCRMATWPLLDAVVAPVVFIWHCKHKICFGIRRVIKMTKFSGVQLLNLIDFRYLRFGRSAHLLVAWCQFVCMVM